jgi:hypothetical protein
MHRASPTPIRAPPPTRRSGVGRAPPLPLRLPTSRRLRFFNHFLGSFGITRLTNRPVWLGKGHRCYDVGEGGRPNQYRKDTIEARDVLRRRVRFGRLCDSPDARELAPGVGRWMPGERRSDSGPLRNRGDRSAAGEPGRAHNIGI